MGNEQSQKPYDIGMIGLGVMGRNLVLNIADHGFSVVGYDKDPAQVKALNEEGENRKIQSVGNIKDFIDALRQPRAIMILVPAGAPVDSVIQDLLEHLQPGDLIIDGGNSYFKDSDVRAQHLSKKGIQFLGLGVSGGEEGARLGPSLMPGGSHESYERVRPILEAIAAHVQGQPCVKWLGIGSAGHFVKMVHNGIEYGLMQLLAEAYDLMKRGLGFDDDEIYDTFATWNQGELNGYLVEITSQIFSKQDKITHNRLIDEILDVANQKGTGMWTSQSAMELQVPIPTIDLAVAMRDLSVFVQERNQGSTIYQRSISHLNEDRETLLLKLQQALYMSMMMTYAQGLSLLKVASNKYNYQIDLRNIPSIWKGGCIIRAAMLEDIFAAFQRNQDLPNLLLDPLISIKIIKYQDSLRSIICQAAQSGIPIPGFMVSLGYFDALRSSWLPANLIQAQRDYFGAHTYERIDSKGTFHMEWKKP
jgi:6-phosphogluconate dehydrogenase